MPWLLLLLGCAGSPAPEDTGPDTVPWSGSLPPLAETIGPTRGQVPLRTIVHLHSPWSHDACDGEGLVDGAIDEACLGDLREALCATSVDVAFLSDHPDHAAWQPWSDLLLGREGDTPIERGGRTVGNRLHCDDGHEVAWLPGSEDVLMPVALDEHAGGRAGEEAHRLYNSDTAEALQAEIAAGGVVLMAHTEGKDPAYLQALQREGLRGVEIFNLHAMFGPDIRQEDLGLDPYGWLSDIAPFTDDDAAAEPDLLFLAVLQEQAPSLARFDELLARGPMVGTAGTDAHQNAMPLVLRDGERGDSYRRMLRWFSNVVLADAATPAAAEEALAAGRLYVAFEALGTPEGFDLYLEADDGVHEMGSDAPAGTLHLDCPELAAPSPRGTEAPEITATLYRDGEPWQTGCGSWEVDGPAVYRARIDIVPHHLRPFLGAEPDRWIGAYPWVYSNAIRVGFGR